MRTLAVGFTLYFMGCLLQWARGEDVVDRMVRVLQARLDVIRDTLLPIPQDMLQEGLFHAASYLVPLDSETELCRNHSNYLFQSFLEKELWAVKMLDASSKLPSGILDGNVMDLGAYQQCLEIEAPGGIFRGQHCVVETEGILLNVSNEVNPKRSIIPSIRLDVMFSLCVPSSCTARDVKAHVNIALNPINASAIVYDTSCSSRLAHPLSAMDWFALLVVLAIILLVVVGTVHDYKYTRSDKKQLLIAFSLSANVPRLLDTRISPAALTCLNGLRVLSMGWVMACHRVIHMLAFPSTRLKTIPERITELIFAPLESGQLSVETFILISGILVSYSYLRYRQNRKSFNLMHVYLYRYLRLTPPLAVMVLLYATLAIRLTDGPLWKRYFGTLQEYCKQNWWTTLAYVNNYVNPFESCIKETWFLASDFQMYIFAPLLLIPLSKKPTVGLACTALLYIITTAGALWNAYYFQLKSGGMITMDRRTEVTQAMDYIKSHVRPGSYIMGIAMGYVLLKVKNGELKIKLKRDALWAGWIISILLMSFSVFFVSHFHHPDYVYTPWLDITFLVLHRHLFSLALCWIILVCTLGYGAVLVLFIGLIDKCLSWRVLLPLTRLTYCNFLVHVLLQAAQTFNQQLPGTLSWTQFWNHMFGDFSLSYTMAALLYLTVEAPSTNVIAWSFRGKNKEETLPSIKENAE